MTKEQFLQIVPSVSPNIVDTVVKLVNEYAPQFEINTPRRMAAFLANVSHESGAFRHVREIWGPTEAQRGYEGRASLGNTEQGDGKKFMGRGYIQITGRANYAALGKYLYSKNLLENANDILRTPAILESPSMAMLSAMWFWHVYKNLNSIMDNPDTYKYPYKGVNRTPFEYTCIRVNGVNNKTNWPNGIDERRSYYKQALKVLR